MPGYKYPNIDSGATPIGSAGKKKKRRRRRKYFITIHIFCRSRTSSSSTT
jgi:hypothetical protein